MVDRHLTIIVEGKDISGGKVLQGLNQDLQQTAQAGKGVVGSFTELKSKIDLVTSGLRMAAGALQTVWELGKEGAALEYTADKFDKLSVSIGTTSDALLGDLRKATGGLISDAELMKSASDMMALGLAKTHDEAVRLSSVAGKLGMDMNQLVLTLTNQTTMRFDALGVSVDGFEQKVKDLEKTGMSANDAFKEAFLQQAEEQIAKVGDKADSGAAAFLRLETSVNNASDALKMKLAPALEGAATGLNEAITISDKTGSSMLAVYTEAVKVALGLETAEEAARNLSGEWDLTKFSADNVTTSFSDLSFGSDELNAKFRDGVIPVMTETKDVITLAAYAAQSAGQDMFSMADATGALASKEAELQGAQNDLAAAMQAWANTAAQDNAAALDGLLGNTQRYMEGLKAIDEVFGTSTATNEEYEQKVEEINKEYARTGDVEAYKKALLELQKQFGDTEEVEAQRAKVEELNNELLNLHDVTYHVYGYFHRIDVNGEGTGGTGGESGGGTGGGGGSGGNGGGGNGGSHDPTRTPTGAGLGGSGGSGTNITLTQNFYGAGEETGNQAKQGFTEAARAAGLL